MSSRSPWAPLAFVAVVAGVASSPACEAEVDEGCTTGPCGGVTVAVASTVTVGGLGGGGGGDPACLFPDTGELPCEVFTIVSGRCHGCHGDPLGIGPFPLVTWQNFQEDYFGRAVWDRADDAIEPDAIPRMPFGGDALPEEERAILNAWFATCAEGACEKAPAPDGASSATGTGGSGSGGSGSGGAEGTGGAGGT